MTTELARFRVDAGALLRRHCRAAFDLIGATWVEHRGWLDSTFVVTATPDQWRRVTEWIRANGFDTSDDELHTARGTR